MIGKTIQGYEILGVRDAGAMGVVYKAKDPNLPRVVAIKLMNRALVEDETFLERFRLEARAIAMVQSPHIVTIHQLIDTPEALAIVMEYVDGISLQELASTQELPWQRSARLIRQVLAGLARAHDAGVIHRDIKPSNVLVLPDDSIKIVDFGLAKAEQSGRNLTQTGASAGTLYYMSPEQVHGFRDVDARTDLYSVGVTFYKLVCGRLPFDTTGSNFEILKEIVEGVFPPADRFNPTLPPSLVRFLSTCMAKKPADRFPDAHAAIRALDAILMGDEGTAQFDRPETPVGHARGVAASGSDYSDDRDRTKSSHFDVVPERTKAIERSNPVEPARTGDAPRDNRVQPARTGAAERDDSVEPRTVEWKEGRRKVLLTATAVVLVIVAGVALRSLLSTTDRADASISVTTQPPGAAIFLDGQEVGPAPIESTTHAAGIVRLRAVLEGFAEVESTLQVAAGESFQIALSLQKSPPADPVPSENGRNEDVRTESAQSENAESSSGDQRDLGAVSIEIHPWGRVWIDGTRMGDGEVRSESFDVEPGTRKIRVIHPDLGTWEKRVEVRAGQSRRVEIDFTREVPVVVTSQGPDGSYLMGEIIVDGRATGATTPKEIRLRMGEHSIEVRRPGYEAAAMRIGVYGPIEDPIQVVLHPQ